jgi:hypothetical protein
MDWFLTFSTLLAVLVCGLLYAVAWLCTLPWQAAQAAKNAVVKKPQFRVVYAAARPAALPIEAVSPTSRSYSRAA